VLVFTRRRDEAIVIGDGIEIRIMRIGRDGVRLGITAPPHVPVHRREIYDLIGAANTSAAGSDAASVARLAVSLRGRARPAGDRP
jgi:carbon storage regulator